MLKTRRRQFREARIVADEAFQMPRAFFDGRQCERQSFQLSALEQFRAGVRQRSDRRQRVVQFVADHPDHFLPCLHFLAAQFGGEQAQQHQFVAAAVETEAAARKMEDVFIVFVADREDAVATALERIAQRLRRAFENRIEAAAFESSAFAQQFARGEIAQHDALRFVHQHHRHRRVLHHGVEQQFALHQRDSLLAQCIAERVVRIHQFDQIAVFVPGDAETEIAVAIARHRTGQRAEQRAQRRHRAPDQHRHQGADHHGRDRACGPCGQPLRQQRGRRRRQHDAQRCQHGQADRQRQDAEELHGRSGMVSRA